MTAASLADRGYSESKHAYLSICGTCYHLYESGRPDGMEQMCQCRKVEVDRWPTYDFNEHAILCRACGLAVLESGSRWHPYFCHQCQSMAIGVTLWQGRLVFPIGRHSAMHTWAPRAPAVEATDSEVPAGADVQGTYQSLKFIARGSEGLWRWYEHVMAQNFAELGLTGNVTLREYMEAIDRTWLDKRIRFRGLCLSFQRPE